MDKTNAQNVPTDVVQTFKEFLGSEVDTSRIQVFPDDGYIAPHHGRFDLYELRRGAAQYKVRKYEDGFLEFI